MSKQKMNDRKRQVNWVVNGTAYWAVADAVDWDVNGAVEKAVRVDLSRDAHWAMCLAVNGAVRWAVSWAVDGAVSEYSPHSGLQDFLIELGVS